MKPQRDQRNALAKARDEWMESLEGIAARTGIASGSYLQNRLEAAFIAGWNGRERMEAARTAPVGDDAKDAG